MVTKNGVTTVKFTSNGVESQKDVTYSVDLAASMGGEKNDEFIPTSLDDALSILKGKLSKEETASNPDLHATGLAVSYINQVLDQNARQLARSKFLADLEGPERTIVSLARKLMKAKLDKGVTISEKDAIEQIKMIMD